MDQLIALNTVNVQRKKALLLHLAGETVHDIYQGLIIHGVAANTDKAVENVYINTKCALDTHFNPKSSSNTYSEKPINNRQKHWMITTLVYIRSLRYGFVNFSQIAGLLNSSYF